MRFGVKNVVYLVEFGIRRMPAVNIFVFRWSL